VGRDCLKVAEECLLDHRWAKPDEIESWRAEVLRKIEDALATVQREGAPDPYKEDWCALASKHLSEPHPDV
jgi:pyruvate dehydrogenase E1 component alpha subunit/2-oxoisovalerate dehydrogenase E1 component alpha subunit